MKQTTTFLVIALLAMILPFLYGCGGYTSGNVTNNTSNGNMTGNITGDAEETRLYVSRDPDECTRVLFQCVPGRQPFFDDTGCGCELANTTDGGQIDDGGAAGTRLAATPCTPEEKSAEACTQEYAPVCGWYNQSVQCIKYPCADTYGNRCTACSDPKVEYWSEGECPTEEELPYI